VETDSTAAASTRGGSNVIGRLATTSQRNKHRCNYSLQIHCNSIDRVIT